MNIINSFINNNKNVPALFKKELRSYFNSPVAYIVIIVFLLISGWFFSSQMFLVKEATISSFLANVPLLFVFIIPAVSMRLFSEELKSGTIKILTTLPIRDHELILSKYLAATALITIAVLATLIHPITVSMLGNIDWGQVVGSYMGLILLAASFVSIGLFASSITRNQIVAFIIGLLICFVLFVMGKVLVLVTPFLLPIVEYISIDYHFNNISKGLIDSRDLVYYASMSGLFLALAYIMVSSRRETKRLQVALYSASTIGLVIGILVVVNYLSFHIFKRIDLTQGGIYSLSKASKKLVGKLDDPVIIKAYFSKNLPAPYNTQSRYLEDLLAEYRAYSGGNVKYSFIDPSEDPEIKKEVHAIGIPPLRFTQIEKDKYEMKEGYMGVVFIYGDKKEVIPLIKKTEGLEYDLTSTIKRLTAAEKKTIGFLTGHDEPDITENHKIYSQLTAQYDVKNVNIQEDDSEIQQVDSLVIMGPESEVTEDELYIIDQFLMKGKNVAFFLNKNTVDLRAFTVTPVETGLEPLLYNYGIGIENGYVLDMFNQTVGITQRQGMFSMTNYVSYPLVPVATNFKNDNLIVKDLEDMTLPFVSPLTILDNEGKDTRTEVLVKSSVKSWHNRELRSINPMQKHYPADNNPKGPLALAATVEGSFNSRFPDKEDSIKKSLQTARIIAAGTSLFLDSRLPNRMESNINFFLNTVDWLIQDDALISIRSKGVTYRPLKDVSSATRIAVKYSNIILMPALFILYGLIRMKARYSRKKNLEFLFQ